MALAFLTKDEIRKKSHSLNINIKLNTNFYFKIKNKILKCEYRYL